MRPWVQFLVPTKNVYSHEHCAVKDAKTDAQSLSQYEQRDNTWKDKRAAWNPRGITLLREGKNPLQLMGELLGIIL